MPWEGADRRAVMRAHEETIALLRRNVRILRGAIVALTVVVAAVLVGSLATWISLQHQRTESRKIICQRIDETRTVLTGFLRESIDQSTTAQRERNPGGVARAKKLILQLDTPACESQTRRPDDTTSQTTGRPDGTTSG